MQNQFRQIWDQLRGKKPHFEEFLDRITIKNFRGIQNLQVDFTYPVSVVAGPNACGKTTVVKACACAYSMNERAFSPSAVFPELKGIKNSEFQDSSIKTLFEYYFTHRGQKLAMQWKRGSSGKWNKSFMGRKNTQQPERPVYVRTLTDLSSPSEIRSFRSIANKGFEAQRLTADQISFAQQILRPFTYESVHLLNSPPKNLLFVRRSDESASYSEFHMSAGERSLLRLSGELSGKKNMLVIIDEVEAGLHPFSQQMLMLELQRQALRNGLQIIVSTHSPVVLECVPPEARIFLERKHNNVIWQDQWKGLIQKSLYGQSIDKLNILCEDSIAESIILGVLDVLNPKLNLVFNDFIIGRDTTKEKFPDHIEALGKFGRLSDFVFVLDGDARDMGPLLKSVGEKYGSFIEPLFLPGNVPEAWLWEQMKAYPRAFSQLAGISEEDFSGELTRLDALYHKAADKPANIIKNKFYDLSVQLRKTPEEWARTISRYVLTQQEYGITQFAQELEDQINRWKNLNE